MRLLRVSMTGGIAAVAFLLALVTITPALVPVAAKADACPNASERFGASANLPDCRAYELVTPPVKQDNSLINDMYGFPDGEHVSFTSILPLPGALNGEAGTTLSSRTALGWVPTSITTPEGPGEPDTLYQDDKGTLPFWLSYTSDFSAAFTAVPFASDPLDQNLGPDLYRVNIPSGSYSLASLPDTGAMTESLYHPPGIPVFSLFGLPLTGSFLAGNSADGSHVFFTTLGRLPTAPGTPADTRKGQNETYERYGGHTYLVGILPDGSVAPCGAELGEGGATRLDEKNYYRLGAVAPDGSNVVFHAYGDGFQNPQCPIPDYGLDASLATLYLRENNGTPQAKTVQLHGLKFLGRSADGSKILSGGEGIADGPIFEYDIPTGQTTTVGEGELIAYSADGSVVYYRLEQEGQLKVYDHGTIKTVPNAGPAYAGKGLQTGLSREANQVAGLRDLAEVTPDGSKLLFLDRANLTSYNANGPDCEEINIGYFHIQGADSDVQNCAEAYVYDLNTGSFTCVSCNPTGAPPEVDVSLFDGPHNDPFFPSTTPLITEDGSRVIFQSTEALVPQDTNGANDVYEWENGHIYLLSSGQGGNQEKRERHGGTNFSGINGSQLIGVSSNGNDVFIATDDHLLPQDIENSVQIYDARVGGGFPYTTPVYGCDSGQCQGPQTPAPLFAPPPSSTFAGVGNTVREEPQSKSKSKSKHKAKSPRHKVKKARHKAKRAQNSGNRKVKGKK